jgi:hypothetical protein
MNAVTRLFGVAVTALVAGGLTGVLGGCGGDEGGVATLDSGAGSGSSPSVAGDAPASDPMQRARQYVGCLRGHGIDLPDPAPGGRGKVVIPDRNQQGLDEALSACRQYAPESESNPEAAMASARAYAACMRENGLADFPDPDPDKGPVFPKSFQSNPAYEAANRACAHHLGLDKSDG